MFKVRVIPCLDVKDGRVVKGLISSICAMPAIRSRPRSPMMRPAPTTLLPRHYRQPRGSRHLARRGPAYRRSLFHAADRRRRGADHRPISGICSRRGGQGFDHDSGGAGRDFVRRGGRKIRRSMHRGRDRRQAGPRRASRSLGNLHPWRPQAHRASTPSPMRRRWSRSAPGKSC